MIIKLGSGFYLHRRRVPGQRPLPRCYSKMADTDRFERCFRQVLIKTPYYDTERTFLHDEFKGFFSENSPFLIIDHIHAKINLVCCAALVIGKNV